MSAEIAGVIFFFLLVLGVRLFFKLLSRGLDARSSKANKKDMLAALKDCQQKGGYIGIAPSGQKIFFPDTEAYIKFDENRAEQEAKYLK